METLKIGGLWADMTEDAIYIDGIETRTLCIRYNSGAVYEIVYGRQQFPESIFLGYISPPREWNRREIAKAVAKAASLPNSPNLVRYLPHRYKKFLWR